MTFDPNKEYGNSSWTNLDIYKDYSIFIKMMKKIWDDMSKVVPEEHRKKVTFESRCFVPKHPLRKTEYQIWWKYRRTG